MVSQRGYIFGGRGEMNAMEQPTSITRRRMIIDSAPGKEFIDAIRQQGDGDALRRYFAVRADWCGGYPLLHDYLVTYGAFSDLLSALDGNQRYALVPTALELALDAPDQLFHAALFLLADMVPDDAIRHRPAGFTDVLLRLRMRAERLSFLPNLTCAWESLASRQRCLKSEGDFLERYTSEQVAFSESAWRRHFEFPLLNFAMGNFKGSSIPLALLRDYFQLLGAAPGQRTFIYATRIEETRYWVWRIPGRAGTAHLFKIIFLRIDQDNIARIGSWDLYQQFSERDTPDAITRRLMRVEFYPCHLPTLEDAAREMATKMIVSRQAQIALTKESLQKWRGADKGSQ